MFPERKIVMTSSRPVAVTFVSYSHIIGSMSISVTSHVAFLPITTKKNPHQQKPVMRMRSPFWRLSRSWSQAERMSDMSSSSVS